MNAKFFRNGVVMLILVVGTVLLLYTWLLQSQTTTTIGYSKFLADVQANKVTTVVQQDEQSLTVTTKDGQTYTTIIPSVLTDVNADIAAAAKKSTRSDRSCPASLALSVRPASDTVRAFGPAVKSDPGPCCISFPLQRVKYAEGPRRAPGQSEVRQGLLASRGPVTHIV